MELSEIRDRWRLSCDDIIPPKADTSKPSTLFIYFYNKVGKVENFPTVNYKLQFTEEWLADEYVQFVLQAVDQVVYIERDVVRSKYLGIVPVERLSGAFKTLTMAYFNRDLKFPLRNLGGNCAEALYQGALDNHTSWNYEGYMPTVLPEQDCYFPELDKLVKGCDVKRWLVLDTPDKFNPVERGRRRREELNDPYLRHF